MDQNRIAHGSASAPEAPADEPASPVNHPAAQDVPGFDAVPLRYRIDGWTPEKQLEYVEALADTGVARQAAARVGMSEQSASRLRRRPEARSFDRACDAAIRAGARRLVSIAFERAVEGTIKGHYYHGELKSEERVYDNRLLIFLISKLGPLLPEAAETGPVLENWPAWMDAIAQGLPEPRPEAEQPLPADAGEDPEDEAEDEDFDLLESAMFDGDEVWEDDGVWWTRFPPPEDFDGEEQGIWGQEGYQRTLTEVEELVAEADLLQERAFALARGAELRDRYFGFESGTRRADLFALREAEPYETSAEPGPPAKGMAAPGSESREEGTPPMASAPAPCDNDGSESRASM